MDDVEDFFRGYGEIESISLKPGFGELLFQILKCVVTYHFAKYYTNKNMYID